MNVVTDAFPVGSLADASLWASWDPSQSAINARVTIFHRGLAVGMATLDYAVPSVAEDGTWILTEADKAFILDAMQKGVSAVMLGMSLDPADTMLAVGVHSHTVPPRAVYGLHVVEQVPLPISVTSAGVVSPLDSGGIISIKSKATGFFYDDLRVPAGEAFTLELPAGGYAASIFPYDRRYAFTEWEFEIA